jgi:hypothetical protein
MVEQEPVTHQETNTTSFESSPKSMQTPVSTYCQIGMTKAVSSEFTHLSSIQRPYTTSVCVALDQSVVPRCILYPLDTAHLYPEFVGTDKNLHRSMKRGCRSYLSGRQHLMDLPLLLSLHTPTWRGCTAVRS